MPKAWTNHLLSFPHQGNKKVNVIDIACSIGMPHYKMQHVYQREYTDSSVGRESAPGNGGSRSWHTKVVENEQAHEIVVLIT